MDPVELRNVNIEPDDESSSGESAQGSYTGIGNSEKAAISSQFANEDAESQKFLTNGFFGEKKLTDYDDEHHPGTTSFGMSSFNLSNAIMGSGILGLSYAMANTGIILFIIMLLAMAILSLYSVHLLLKTAKEGGSLIYEKLGEKAFGWPGKIGAFMSITMQNIGVLQTMLQRIHLHKHLARRQLLLIHKLPGVLSGFLEWRNLFNNLSPTVPTPDNESLISRQIKFSHILMIYVSFFSHFCPLRLQSWVEFDSLKQIVSFILLSWGHKHISSLRFPPNRLLSIWFSFSAFSR